MKMNPVYKREITLSSRSVKISCIILIFNILLAAVALLNMYLMLEDVKLFGEVRYAAFLKLYLMVASIEFILLVLIIPALTAGSISGERERQTLDLMITTRMTPADIIWGKLFSSFDTIFLLVISSFPILSLVFIFGGIKIYDMLILLVIFYNTAIVFGSVSIWFSALFKRTSLATIFSYITETVIWGGTVGLCYAVFYIQRMRYSDYFGQMDFNIGGLLYLMLLNPAITFYALINRQAGDLDALLVLFNQFGSYEMNFVIQHWIPISVAIQFVIGMIFMLLAIRAINPMAKRKKSK